MLAGSEFEIKRISDPKFNSARITLVDKTSELVIGHRHRSGLFVLRWRSLDSAQTYVEKLATLLESLKAESAEISDEPYRYRVFDSGEVSMEVPNPLRWEHIAPEHRSAAGVFLKFQTPFGVFERTQQSTD